MLGAYRFLTQAGWPLVLAYLGLRLRRGKEDPLRFSERLGNPGMARPEGPLIWLHGASVGEALSLLSLMERLRQDRPAVRLLLTTGTVTSARMIAPRLPEGAGHQFLPVDRPKAVECFLDHWRPDLVLWTESEFWPNMLCSIGARQIPTVLINGRVSLKSFKGWQRFPGFIHRLLQNFDLALGQTDTDAERLKKLGARATACVGNLKFAAAPLPVDTDHLAALQDAMADRPLWLAASTWPGEEEIISDVHRELRTRHPGLLTIIVPRHPHRAQDIHGQIARRGLKAVRRSQGRLPAAETDIYLADTLGELGLFLRIANVVFVGKSLTAHGGQNPIEPARLGLPVLFGPNMENFAEVRDRMLDAGAGCAVTDETTLTDAVDHLLQTPEAAKDMGTAAKQFALAEAEVLDRLMATLEPYLTDLAPKTAGNAA